MFERRGVRLGGLAPLIDGEVPPHRPVEGGWVLDDGARIGLTISEGGAVRIDLAYEGERRLDSLGLRFTATGARTYLRNGYQSWDGSFFATPGSPAGEGPAARAPTLGFAMTALLPAQGGGAVVLGYERHDRFQTRFRFGGTTETMTIDAETLLDRTGVAETETLLLFDGGEVEESLRDWSRLVAAASPLPPRVPERRITGWCSWYSLYAAIDEAIIGQHLAAARVFRSARSVPLDIFLIDDGFTPEMGDWLDVKPQFPRGMAPLLAEIDAAGFTPGLWIAPFLVGNRSRLFKDHPDWLVQDREIGGPLVHMRFYGEFRWHKRSEEYHVLDITHPDAEAYIRRVFRIWRDEWGARYFKTDFMFAGMEYGPERARWRAKGLSRVAIWRRMATLIRDEIGDALWLGCGCPLWASVGLIDAARIGRDIGVTWGGDYSAESLLRDQLTRNHASGLLWMGDPDCILLRSHFHELSADQQRSLAYFAGLTGGVLMTSDKLDELDDSMAALFASLLDEPARGCKFPHLGAGANLIVQQAGDITNCFNPADYAIALDDGTILAPHASRVETRGLA